MRATLWACLGSLSSLMMICASHIQYRQGHHWLAAYSATLSVYWAVYVIVLERLTPTHVWSVKLDGIAISYGPKHFALDEYESLVECGEKPELSARWMTKRAFYGLAESTGR